MNYRHAFHAGNFADVFKHATLARVLVHLCEKPAALRVIDTHAGAGVYDLTGEEAGRTGEWKSGIGRLFGAPLAPDIAALLAPYRDAVASLNGGGALRLYPGSPALALNLLRPQDRLTACELEPTAAAALARHLRADARARVVAIDGWVALNAYVPPQERRGLVIVDPPFEARDEFARSAAALIAAQRKWATGTFMLWYPVKERRAPAVLARQLRASGMAKILRAELHVAAADGERLSGAGLIMVNPPWRLSDELAVILPGLAALLAQKSGSDFLLDWITSE